MARNERIAVNGTSKEVFSFITGAKKRRSFFITNVSGIGVVVTVAVGKVPAKLDAGIPLEKGSLYFEVTTAGFTCTQNAIQIIASAPGFIGIQETFEGDI